MIASSSDKSRPLAGAVTSGLRCLLSSVVPTTGTSDLGFSSGRNAYQAQPSQVAADLLPIQDAPGGTSRCDAFLPCSCSWSQRSKPRSPHPSRPPIHRRSGRSMAELAAFCLPTVLSRSICVRSATTVPMRPRAASPSSTPASPINPPACSSGGRRVAVSRACMPSGIGSILPGSPWPVSPDRRRKIEPSSLACIGRLPHRAACRRWGETHARASRGDSVNSIGRKGVSDVITNMSQQEQMWFRWH